jgi:hypothetical protein
MWRSSGNWRSTLQEHKPTDMVVSHAWWMFITQDEGADNQPNFHLDPLTNPKANEVEITSQSPSLDVSSRLRARLLGSPGAHRAHISSFLSSCQ